jgi:hypothetical protein
MKEVLGSSETSVLTRATCSNIPEDTILHSHRRENLKSYRDTTCWNSAPSNQNCISILVRVICVGRKNTSSHYHSVINNHQNSVFFCNHLIAHNLLFHIFLVPQCCRSSHKGNWYDILATFIIMLDEDDILGTYGNTMLHLSYRSCLQSRNTVLSDVMTNTFIEIYWYMRGITCINLQGWRVSIRLHGIT